MKYIYHGAGSGGAVPHHVGCGGGDGNEMPCHISFRPVILYACVWRSSDALSVNNAPSITLECIIRVMCHNKDGMSMQNKAVEILIYLLGYLAENNFEFDARQKSVSSVTGSSSSTRRLPYPFVINAWFLRSTTARDNPGMPFEVRKDSTKMSKLFSSSMIS